MMCHINNLSRAVLFGLQLLTRLCTRVQVIPQTGIPYTLYTPSYWHFELKKSNNDAKCFFSDNIFPIPVPTGTCICLQNRSMPRVKPVCESTISSVPLPSHLQNVQTNNKGSDQVDRQACSRFPWQYQTNFCSDVTYSSTLLQDFTENKNQFSWKLKLVSKYFLGQHCRTICGLVQLIVCPRGALINVTIRQSVCWFPRPRVRLGV